MPHFVFFVGAPLKGDRRSFPVAPSRLWPPMNGAQEKKKRDARHVTAAVPLL